MFSTFARRFTTAAPRFAAKKAAAAPSKPVNGPVLNLCFAMPNETISRGVSMVIVPAETGLMGILADHAPTVAQLKPGVVSIYTQDTNDLTHRYFIPGGNALIQANSVCSITVPEAIPLEELDVAAAKKRLDYGTSLLSKATTDAEKAQAQAEIDLAQAVVDALEQK